MESNTTSHRNDIAISVRNLNKVYPLYNSPRDRMKEALHPRRKKYHKDFYALKDVSFEIRKGEVIGVVGKNGSGKSTLLKILSRVLTQTSGVSVVNGSVSSLLELGSGFNPELTGIENIYFYGTILGLSEKKIKDKLHEIIDFSDIGDFIFQPIKTYSSGMRARLAFSVAINVDPDVLILDEVLSVGDSLFRRKCYARMENFFKGEKTILFVSHSVPDVNELCTRAVLLDKGELLLDGPTKLVTAQYERFLFAKPDIASKVREDIILLNSDDALKKATYEEIRDKRTPQPSANTGEKTKPIGVNKEDRIKDDIGQQKAYLIPGLKPKSTVEYRNYNVDIFDIGIYTLNERKVNCLFFNERYKYRVRFRANESNLSNVAMGFEIKNEKGMKISSIESAMLNRNDYLIEKVNAGEVIKVEYYFKCLLLPGVYYTNNGISSFNESGQTVLNRLVDACAFKVEDNGTHFSYGLFPCVSQIEITGSQSKIHIQTAVKDLF